MVQHGDQDWNSQAGKCQEALGSLGQVLARPWLIST